MKRSSKSKETSIDGVTVISLSSGSTRDFMDSLHSYAEDVIRFYSKTIGFYPHKSLKIIPGSSDCDGGYPVGTGVIAIHRVDDFNEKPESWWRWIVAHEIAHMYFGYCVHEKHPEPGSQLGWITKGLGLYLDSLYMREKVRYTKYHLDYIQTFLDAKNEGKNTSFFLTPEEIQGLDFDYNDVVMHGRAYYVMSEIENIVGSEKFKDLVIDLVQGFKSSKFGFEELVLYLQKTTGRDSLTKLTD